MTPFGGKHVLVTGASGALGRHVVRTFLALGARVAAAARRRTALEDLRSEMGGSDRLDTCEADVADPERIEVLFDALERGTGPLWAVVHCVGAYGGGKVADTSDAAFRALVETNFVTSFQVLRSALRRMVPRGAGRVVLVSSTGAVQPSAGSAVYGAVKAAVLHLVEAAALGTAGTGVTVNVLMPGTMDTPENRTAMPKGASGFARPEDVAAAAAFLASEDASGVNGARLVVPAPRP